MRNENFATTMPLVVLGILLTLLNDAYLKQSSFSGYLTGKISDFSGVFFFPFFVFDLLTLPARFRSSWRIPLAPNAVFGVALGFCFIVFAGLKTSQPALGVYVKFYQAFLGVDVKIVQDPTDLWALLILPFSYYYFKTGHLNIAKPAVVLFGLLILPTTALSTGKKARKNQSQPAYQWGASAGYAIDSPDGKFKKLKKEFFDNKLSHGYKAQLDLSIRKRGRNFLPIFKTSLFFSEVSNLQKYGNNHQLKITHQAAGVNIGMKQPTPRFRGWSLFMDTGTTVPLIDQVLLESASGSTRMDSKKKLGLWENNVLPIGFFGIGVETKMLRKISTYLQYTHGIFVSPSSISLGATYVL